MADTWGAPSPSVWGSTSAWQPQPTDWQTTPAWQPTDWQTTTYWQTPTTYWQTPTTYWQPPPSSYAPSSVVSLTSALPASSSIPPTSRSHSSSSVSRSTTSNIPVSAVVSSIGSVTLSKSSIASNSTGLSSAHQTSTPQITIFRLDKGHFIAIGICSFIVLLSLIGLVVFCCIRRRRRRPPTAHQIIQTGHYQKANRGNVESAYSISEEIRRSYYTDDRTLYDRRDSGKVSLLRDSFLAFPSPPSLRDSRTESLSFGNTSNRSSRALLPGTPTRQIGNPISLLGRDSFSAELHPYSPTLLAPPSTIQPINSRRADALSTSPFLLRLPAVNISDESIMRKTMTPIPVQNNKSTSNIPRARLRRSKPASKRLIRKKSRPAAPTTSESFQCAGEESDSDRTDTPSIYSQASAPLGATPLSRGGSVSSGTRTDDSPRLSVLFEMDTFETAEYKGGDL